MNERGRGLTRMQILAMVVSLGAATALNGDDSIDAMLRTAREHLQRGRYAEAIDAYRAVQTKLPQATVEETLDPAASTRLIAPARPPGAAAALGLSAAQDAIGELAESRKGIERAIVEFPKLARLHAVLGRHQRIAGEYDAARASLAKALSIDSDDAFAHLEQAHLDRETGRVNEADVGYRWLVRYYNRAQPKDAETLVLVGQGSAWYANWHGGKQIFQFVVNTLSVDAVKADPLCWEARLLAGRLLISKYNAGDARKELDAALAINPNSADAHAAAGEAAAMDDRWNDAISAADRALAINPRHREALGLRIDAALASDDPRTAAHWLDRALAVAPRDPRNVGRRLAYLAMTGPVPSADRLRTIWQDWDAKAGPQVQAGGACERELIAYRAVNGRPGEAVLHLGEQLQRHRRFPEAEVCYRFATSVMPQLPEAKRELAQLLLQNGDVTAAQDLLDAAFKADPYHVQVSNLRKVARLLGEYQIERTPHFIFRFDKHHDAILVRHLGRHLEELYGKYREQYQYEPPGPTPFETYHDANGQTAHAWFSTRMVGLPWLQTIGASTGRIIAIASPTALEKPYNWGSVARHELTHVFNLQQTEYRVPHWFTEALAQRAEELPRPLDWNRLIVKRVRSGELRTTANLTEGFTRAKNAEDWGFAYCQSALYADYVVERFGEASLGKWLFAFRDGQSTSAGIETLFQVSVDDFEKGYREFLQARAKALEASLGSIDEAAIEEAGRNRPDDDAAQGEWAWLQWNRKRRAPAIETARRVLARSPKQPAAAAVVGDWEIKYGKIDEAVSTLDRALEDTNDGANSPDERVLRLRAEAAKASSDWNGLLRWAERGWTLFPTRLDWLELQRTAAQRLRDRPRLKATLGRLARYSNDDKAVPWELAQMAADDSAYDDLEREARNVLFIDPEHGGAHRLLGLALLKQRRAAEAIVELETAKQLSPDDAAIEPLIEQARQSTR